MYEPGWTSLDLQVSDLFAIRRHERPGIQALGLEKKDHYRLELPDYQRGITWTQEKIAAFHQSLINGYPVGVIVLAERVRDPASEDPHVFEVIDGQQRIASLNLINDRFWRSGKSGKHSIGNEPRYRLSVSTQEEWQLVDSIAKIFKQDPHEIAEFIVDIIDRLPNPEIALKAQAGRALHQPLIKVLGLSDSARASLKSEIMPARFRSDGDLEDLTKSEFLDTRLQELGTLLWAQQRRFQEVSIPIIKIGRTFQTQLSEIFIGLNSGEPLRSYELFAAQWSSHHVDMSGLSEKATQGIVASAKSRIIETYSVDKGYDIEPNVEMVTKEDFSFFDFLYGFSRLAAEGLCKELVRPGKARDQLMFKVAALMFSGGVRVDGALVNHFPNIKRADSITTFYRTIDATVKVASSALNDEMKVFTGVSDRRMSGQLGELQLAVYLASIAATIRKISIVKGGHTGGPHQAHLENRRNNQLTIRGSDETMSVNKRIDRLTQTLKSWYLLDSLTDVFQGGDAYSSARSRVWLTFSPDNGALEESEEHLNFPPIGRVLDALALLFIKESDVLKTPEQRRLSPAGAVLYRIAYSQSHRAGYEIEHIFPIGNRQAAVIPYESRTPLNHIANQMPLRKAINGARGNADWLGFLPSLSGPDQMMVRKLLLVEPEELAGQVKLTRVGVLDVLLKRYILLVEIVMEDRLQHAEWLLLDPEERTRMLNQHIDTVCRSRLELPQKLSVVATG